MNRIPTSEYKNRILMIRKAMNREGLDALFVYADHYRCQYTSYFSNYRPMDCTLNAAGAVLIPLEAEPTVFVSLQNYYSCKRHCWIKDVRDIWNLDNTLRDVFAEKKIRNKKIGIVGEELLPLKLFTLMKKWNPDIDFKIKTYLVTNLMAIKSPTEIKLLKEAAEFADLGVEEALKVIQPGKKESEIAAIAEKEVVMRGGIIEEDTLVRSGERTYPPGLLKYTTRVLQEGDFITIDFHPSVEAYLADLSRTVIIKKGTQKQKDALNFAHDLRLKIAEAIKPGKCGLEIHNEIYNFIRKSGYLDNWDLSFGTGRTIAHGLGMGEENWNNITKESKIKILPNMTFALRVNLVDIESQGIHFEDAIVVTEKGTRFLNKASLNLIV